MFDNINKKIDNYIDLLIDLQRNLTSRPAIAPEAGGDGEYEKVMWLKEFISSWGFDDITEIDVPDDRVSAKTRPTLILTINGREPSRNIWIIAHTDVVPAGELSLWNTKPFEIHIDGDLIYGRGVEDNQQSLVSALLAAKAVLETKSKPRYNIKLMFVADEEVGSSYGINWILKNMPDLFDKNDLIVVPDTGDVKGEQIEVSEKSILWVEFRIVGKQSHGSRPIEGINAARAGAYLTVGIDALRHHYNISDGIYTEPCSTIELTKCFNSVTNMNTIPGEQIIGFDCRMLPQYDLNELAVRMRKIADGVEAMYGVQITMKELQHVQAAEPTKTTDEVYIRFSESVKEVTGIQPYPVGIGGGTVAASFREIGLPVALWSTLNETCHSPNEHSSIKATIKDAKVFADFMLK